MFLAFNVDIRIKTMLRELFIERTQLERLLDYRCVNLVGTQN